MAPGNQASEARELRPILDELERERARAGRAERELEARAGELRERTDEGRRARQQGAIADLGRRGIVGSEPQTLMERAARTVSEILDVELTEVLELLPSEDELLLRAGTGWDQGVVGLARVPAGTESHAGYTLETGAPVLVEDQASERRFSVPALLREHGAVSGIAVTIEGREGPFGVLGAHSRGSRSFSRDDIHFLEAVANILAAAVARQKAEQLEEQLDQAQRLESVGQLAGGIAHDFNNILSVILNYASFAMDELDDTDGVRHDIDEIRKAAERAAELTKHLLVFSRRDMVQAEVIDLEAVVRQTEGFLRRSIGEHIELRTRLAPDLPKVRTGSGQLDQVVVNLVLNAREAMPKGGRITVETRTVYLDERYREAGIDIGSGRYVQLSVSDTGSGMSKEVAERAFDPFFTTKVESEGTGLGLATVYGIARQSGGHALIYSEPGRGTTVKVYLPAVEGEVETAPTAPSSAAAGIQGQGEVVMVVEDDRHIREVAKRILSEHGYEVLTASDGAAARTLARERHGEVDLLLTDIVMPELSGSDLAEGIRAVRPDLRVVFMSGYTGDVISRHGTLAEGELLIEKPFSAVELLRAVREALVRS